VAPLAIFDLDGTLIDSTVIDHQCFLETFEAEFGLPAMAADWRSYPHQTDRGLTHEFLRGAWSRDPNEAEIARHRAAFIARLRGQAVVLHEIRGARAFIDFIQERGWKVALATGSWSDSAKLKLDLAGFPADLPLACCDNCVSREEILQQAIGNGQHSRIVVFGDGPWDVTAARNLNLPFVGIGGEELRRAGATEVIADFGDAEGVLAAMLRARPPRP
jgi:beta-phosphoglucomutase-like phosphatase (HAD superfamily)